MEEKDTIKEKTRKLLAVANDKSITQQESETFLAKAYQLMMENKLTSEDIKDTEIVTDNTAINPEDKNKRSVATWKIRLVQVLQEFIAVYPLKAGSKIYLCGKVENIRDFKELYNFCIIRINLSCAKDCRGKGKIFTNSYRIGCCFGIYSAISMKREEFKEAYDEKALLVLDNVEREKDKIKDKIKEEFDDNIKSHKTHSNSKINPDAYIQGVNTGVKIYHSKENSKERETLS